MEGARNWGKIKFQNLEPATDVAYKGDDEICTNVEFLQNSKGGESSSSAMATMVVFKFTIIWVHTSGEFNCRASAE